MRLLVTRPEPFAAETAAALTQAGHAVLVQPLLTVSLLPPPPAMPDPAAIVVTSRNAVRALAAWPDAAAWRARPVFAVGPGTGRALTEAGFGDVRIGGGDAAALPSLIASAMAANAGTIVHVAGRERAADIAGALTARGLTAVTVEGYASETVGHFPVDVKTALSEGRLDGVLLYSPRTARAFVAAARTGDLMAALRTMTVFALSEAVAAIVRPMVGEVVVAAAPDEDAMLAAVAIHT